MPLPKLLALDGTLLDSGSQLSAEHMQLVQEAKAAGIEVAIVTGRPLLTTKWVWERLQLDTPVVCFNGVWVGIPGEAPFAQAHLEEADVREIVQHLGDLPGSICVYPGVERWLIHRFTPRTKDWHLLYGVTIEEQPQLLQQWSGPSCKVMFVTEPETLQPVLAEFRQKVGHKYHVVASQEDRFEIHKPGITKAWGLERLAASMGIDQSDVWAVGDAPNDIEMLQWAGVSCAMGHAQTHVKEAAQYILPPISENGLCGLRSLWAELS